jgi:hypothetical protein
MGTVAVGIICKTPRAGSSKTRLSPPLQPQECAEISACFISDLAGTIETLSSECEIAGHAVYTPSGSEGDLRRLLPASFHLTLQGEGDLGARLNKGINDLLAAGYSGAILVNSDSPTLPRSILKAAVDAVTNGDRLVISPAIDGGYTFIGLSRPHPHLFARIPWSTREVFELTLERAREVDLPTVVLESWYDVDDAASYAILEAEMDGIAPDFADHRRGLQDAPNTRRFITSRRETQAPRQRAS